MPFFSFIQITLRFLYGQAADHGMMVCFKNGVDSISTRALPVKKQGFPGHFFKGVMIQIVVVGFGSHAA